MPSFVSESETKEIQAPWWDPKETCTIRRFSYGDRQWLAGKTMSIGTKPDTGDSAVADVLIAQMNLAILERGIVRWTDADGQALPVTSQMIEQLTEKDAEFILTEINTLNPRQARSEDEQATFRGGAGDRVTE
jgi:hypothetical protein